jgi:anhydro-N-acetylmuramic acid kinase
VSILRAIGLMSGTSLDGIDAAVLDTDGQGIAAFGPTAYRPYGDAERSLLLRALADGRQLSARQDRPGVLAEAESFVTETHAETVSRLLRDNAIDPQSVAVVGFHGQTVLHRPKARLTVQLGDGAALAERLGLPVAYDFRAADVAAGGQGAPLVPLYHAALARSVDRPQPLAVLNIGGVANVTYVDRDDPPLACDTGPGNALLDDFIRLRTGEPFDWDGRHAAAGRADEHSIVRALADPFFAEPPPKSLDRDAFALGRPGLPEFSVEDGAATLTALTAAAVARVVPHLPRAPRNWIVCGGGAHNPTLMRMLAEQLAPATVETAHAVGWATDFVEAQAFAFLAVRSLRGQPITFPTTTGAPTPLPGGVIAQPTPGAGQWRDRAIR